MSGSTSSANAMPFSILERTLALNPYIPHLPTPRQIAFLRLECLDALYGGAAGGGKSDALLMAALQFVEVPGYSALLLRRTLPELRLPGGLIDRAFEWLNASGATWRAQEAKWVFPSGATLQFGYCEREQDVHRYQSSEFQFVGMDEATQFTERQLRYLFSRLRRRVDIPVPLRYRLASNPGNVGHDYVKGRYITHPDDRVFVPAKLDDNPHIDREQYLRSLAQLDPLTRQQLLAGDWDAVAGGRFLRDWFRRYTMRGDHIVCEGKQPILPSQCLRFATCDIAASIRTTADYTVISSWAITPSMDLVWLDCVRGRWEIPDIVPRMQQVYDRWGLSFICIEGGGTQQGVYQMARRTRMAAREVMPGVQDKLVRATRAIVLAESGRLYLPTRADWLGDVESELTRFTGDEKRDSHDDIVDTLSYAADQLTRHQGMRETGFAPKVL